MLYLREINRGAFLKGGSLRGFPLSGERGTKQWDDPNLQLSGKGNQMGSGFPKRRMTTAHASRRLLALRIFPRDAQRDAHLAEVAPQAHSMLSLFSGKRSEIPLPSGNRRIREHALKAIY
jgi:hypothetical protein